MSAGICRSCARDITWAFTLPGRKRIPLDPERHDADDQAANVAVRRDHLGGLIARVLKAGEQLEVNEWRAIAHFATCPPLVAARDARAGRLRSQGVLPLPKAGRSPTAAHPTPASVTTLARRKTLDRSAHVAWAKARAIEYCDAGAPDLAISSLISDLRKHPDTAGHSAIELSVMLEMAGKLSTTSEVREWIDGVL